jgi:hypothetical protein
MTTPLSLEWLDGVRAVPVAPGEHVTLHAVARTVDGVELGPTQLFDLSAGGLSIVQEDPLSQTVETVPTGIDGPGCVAAGAVSPCLVPRVAALAHARLLTARELMDALTGTIEVHGSGAIVGATAEPPVSQGPSLALLVTCAAAAAILLLAVVIRTVRGHGPLGAVRRAARDARRSTRSDGTLAHVRAQIELLVAHARELDRARRACEKKRAGIDRASLARGLATERTEAARIDEDLARARADLDRVASALRLVALHVRDDRSARCASGLDPVAELEVELALGDEEVAELNRVP